MSRIRSKLRAFWTAFSKPCCVFSDSLQKNDANEEFEEKPDSDMDVDVSTNYGRSPGPPSRDQNQRNVKSQNAQNQRPQQQQQKDREGSKLFGRSRSGSSGGDGSQELNSSSQKSQSSSQAKIVHNIYRKPLSRLTSNQSFSKVPSGTNTSHRGGITDYRRAHLRLYQSVEDALPDGVKQWDSDPTDIYGRLSVTSAGNDVTRKTRRVILTQQRVVDDDDDDYPECDDVISPTFRRRVFTMPATQMSGVASCYRVPLGVMPEHSRNYPPDGQR